MPAGRRRHSCDKCLNDHKSCDHVYNSDGILVGCRRCLQMASVGYCSISSSHHAFMSMKTKSSSPNCDMISGKDDSVRSETDANDDDKTHTPPPVNARSSPNCDMISRRDDLLLAANNTATRGYSSLEDEEMDETQTVVDSGDSEYYPSDADEAESAHGIGINKSTREFSRRYAETPSSHLFPRSCKKVSLCFLVFSKLFFTHVM